MICKFTHTDERGHYCPTCERSWNVPSAIGKSYRTCRKEEPKRNPRDCIHHGGKIGERQCTTCAGRVMVFIFDCSLLGKCSDEKKFPDVAGCKECGRFTAPAAISG